MPSSRTAQGYSWNGKVLRNGEYVSPTQPFAAGMLVSTVSDLVKWDAALASEKLLKKSTLESMWAPSPLSKGSPAEYGMGWQVSPVNGHRLVSHGGGIPGFSTQISRFVDDRLTVIVLANTDDGRAGSIAQDIASRVLPALMKKAEGPIADSDAPTTSRLKGILLGAMKGEADPALFTAEAQKEMLPRIKERQSDVCRFRCFEDVSAPGAEGDRCRHAVAVSCRLREGDVERVFRARQDGQDRGPWIATGGVAVPLRV